MFELWREFSAEIQHVLILKNLQREVRRVDVKVLAVRRLVIYDKIQVEGHDVVGNLQSVIKMIPLVPSVEDVLGAPSQIVEPHLRKAGSVIFSHDSRPEIRLLHRSQVVMLERILS